MNIGIIGLFCKSVKTKQGVILLRPFDRLRAMVDRREKMERQRSGVRYQNYKDEE